MAKYTNFYETIKEANMRLQHTVVLYDGEPHYVLCICDHKSDGIFRVYLDPCGDEMKMAMHMGLSIPYEWHEDPTYPNGIGNTPVYHKARGEKMDAWMEANPGKILRKMMNSPAFNKFRPYELGMMNTKHGAIYAQRSPTRHTQQGLTTAMISATPVSLEEHVPGRSRAQAISLTSDYFRQCVKGAYPSAEECITALKSKDVANNSAAFHRHFALVRGPVSSLFLQYKEDVIGIIPSNKPDQVLLGTEFSHCKEVVEALGTFQVV